MYRILGNPGCIIFVVVTYISWEIVLAIMYCLHVLSSAVLRKVITRWVVSGRATGNMPSLTVTCMYVRSTHMP